MQNIVQAFTDISLIVDISISLAGLIFMCMLIYAMRWLPGIRANDPAVTELGIDGAITETPLLPSKPGKLGIARGRETANTHRQLEEVFD